MDASGKPATKHDMFRFITGSPEHFLGNWVRQSDNSTVTCTSRSLGHLQCVWGSGQQEYLITGTRITRKEVKQIGKFEFGNLNGGKDIISWTCTNGNKWLKQGNNLKIT